MKPLTMGDRDRNKNLCAFVVLVFDVLENEMGLKTASKIRRMTGLCTATIYRVRRMAEKGTLKNRGQIRTIQRLAEVAGLKCFQD